MACLSTFGFLLVIVIGIYQDSDVSLDLAVFTRKSLVLIVPLHYIIHCLICLDILALHVLLHVNYGISEIHQLLMLLADGLQLLLHLRLFAP